MQRFLLDGKTKSTHVSNYTMETLSQQYDLDKLTKGMFTLSFKIYTIINRKILVSQPNKKLQNTAVNFFRNSKPIKILMLKNGYSVATINIISAMVPYISP